LSINNFIPEVWSGVLLKALTPNLVYGNLFNSDYQGEITRQGDTVRITSIGDIEINDYSKDTDIKSPQALTDAQTTLSISQAKYYNFEIDDVDQAQSMPGIMAAAMEMAAYRLAQEMDRYYAGFYVDAISANTIGSADSPVTPDKPTYDKVGGGTTVYDYLIILNQLLTHQSVPKVGRWAVIPPWVKSALLQDPRFTSFNTPDARETITNGQLDASAGQAPDAYLGRIEKMDIYESVNAPHLAGDVGLAGSVDVIFAGHSMAVTKAAGLTKTEAYRPPSRFADAVKGLALYGAKTIRPYAVAAAYLRHP